MISLICGIMPERDTLRKKDVAVAGEQATPS